MEPKSASGLRYHVKDLERLADVFGEHNMFRSAHECRKAAMECLAYADEADALRKENEKLRKAHAKLLKDYAELRVNAAIMVACDDALESLDSSEASRPEAKCASLSEEINRIKAEDGRAK